jgi:predicted phosphate transport protein (TIGR00153 family)
MLFGGKKEREAEELMRRHVEVVGRVITDLQLAIKEYCTDCVEFDDRAIQVQKGESEADDIRRDLEQRLCDGAFMPVLRGDYSHAIESIDKIANQCEAVAQYMLLTRPQLDEKAQEGLVQIMDTTVLCFRPLMEMFEQFGKGQEVIKLAHKVEEGESDVDDLFAGIVSRLFKSDLDLAVKLHVKMLLDRAAAISNRIEDASDWLLIMATKRPG